MDETTEDPAEGEQTPDHTPRGSAFPIVGIGASAGGLEALREIFSHLPDDTGMAFVVIQHLGPDRPSQLSSVLAGDVDMPVIEVPGDTRVEPNRVYVIPSHADLTIDDGLLSLVPRPETRELHLPIDSFFTALAEDVEDRAVGVVLSGSASDGTEGMRAIKSAGGITFVQEPATAQFKSMPESAIAAGVADFQLAPREIASDLVRLRDHPYLASPDDGETSADPPPTDDEEALRTILSAVRKHAATDFTGYKESTVMRRIARRMALEGTRSIDDYAGSIGDDPAEAKALAHDLLIHVTSFFRDPDAFEALREQVLPELVEQRDDDETIRVWVPGCSTGEEVYSIAICLFEHLAEHDRHLSIKIFGSDLGEEAITTARAGVYTESDVEGVDADRLERFFDHVDGNYRIEREIRDACVFVQHDLTRDPPFARLDLISCRNVLIYFGRDLQAKVVPLFHHSLNDTGYLFLGSSEDVGDFDEIFAPVDKEHRIFRKAGESPPVAYPLVLGRTNEANLPVFEPDHRPRPARIAQRQADHILLARYAPPGVVIDDQLEVVQFRGRTGAFLEPPPGQPQLNLLKLARDGLESHLREAIQKAESESITIRREGLRLKNGAHLDIEVMPLPRGAETEQRHFLVVFEATDGAEGRPTEPQARLEPASESTADEEIERLQAELTATQDFLQAITGEHRDTTQELGAANEELIAANEELQSMNEELQSAKEELQSTNEELSTLNDELQNRNEELDLVANDLVNVLESVQIPVIMVDHELRIRRFTPTAQQISSLVQSDVGRSIDDVKLNVKVDDLVDKIRTTVDSLTAKEYEVQGADDRWFKLHIRPYKTADGRLDGAIVSFFDVDALKRTLEEAERARDYAQRMVETVPVPLIVLDGDLRVVSANSPFRKKFMPRSDRTGHPELFELSDGALDVAPLKEATEQSLASGEPFQSLEIEIALPTDGDRVLVLSGCPIEGTDPGERRLLLAVDDITEHRQLEASEKQARLEAERANRAKDLFLATLSHELRTPLNTLVMSAQLLRAPGADDAQMSRASAAIERAVKKQVRLIDDLLDISRIVTGKLTLDLRTVDLATVVEAAVDVAKISAEEKGVDLDLDLRGDVPPIHGDPERLQQVVSNLLTNAIKFTPQGGRITLSLEEIDGRAQLRVTDTGVGISSDILPTLFDRFVQAESSMTRAHGGLGLGLAIVRHLVDVHGGEVHAESPGEGEGSTFTVTLPLAPSGAQESDPEESTVAHSIEGVRVLLVEDDDDTREACTLMIKHRGAEVEAASSVTDGLAALESFEPDVILCDVAMPGEDGYAFLRQLREMPERKEIPIAALTALAGEEDRRRALDAGFDMHLAKPIGSERITVAISTLVRER